jgi:hypothetical protein
MMQVVLQKPKLDRRATTSIRLARVRKIVTIVEEPSTPLQPDGETRRLGRIVSVAAVVENPLARRYDEDLSRLFEIGFELGADLARRAIGNIGHERVVAIGKAALVGLLGEIEHATALTGGGLVTAVRRQFGDWQVVSPSTRQHATPGGIIPVSLQPLARRGSEPLPLIRVYVRNHPQPDEAVILLTVATGIGD